MCEEGRLQSFVTPGGHRRVALAEIEGIRERNPNPDPRSPAGPSPVLRQKKEHIEELNLTLQEKKAQKALQEVEDEERQTAAREEAAQEEQQREARRMRVEAQSERVRRQRERDQARVEAQAAQSQQEWEAEWLREMLRNLPPETPPELRLEVTEAIRPKLPELYHTSAGHAEDLVGVALRAIVEKTLCPWRRGREAERAADEALNELPFFARGIFGQLSDWQRSAREQALAAISELPETATFAQMAAAARRAVKHVAEEYEHNEKCTSFMNGVSRSLPAQLSFSSSQARAKAEEAVRAAVANLPIGVSSREFDDARDAALEPFVAIEAQARAEYGKQQATAKLEVEAALHLRRVFYYLSELQADPDGWDFEGKLYQYSKQIAEDIKPDLIEELPLDLFAGRRRVEQLTDEWLASRAPI